MTPTDWSQAQSKDPILTKILEVIHNKTIIKCKLKPDMDFDLKSIIILGKQMKTKQGVLYRKTIQINNKLCSNLFYPVNIGKEP